MRKEQQRFFPAVFTDQGWFCSVFAANMSFSFLFSRVRVSVRPLSPGSATLVQHTHSQKWWQEKRMNNAGGCGPGPLWGPLGGCSSSSLGFIGGDEGKNVINRRDGGRGTRTTAPAPTAKATATSTTKRGRRRTTTTTDVSTQCWFH